MTTSTGGTSGIRIYFCRTLSKRTALRSAVDHGGSQPHSDSTNDMHHRIQEPRTTRKCGEMPNNANCSASLCVRATGARKTCADVSLCRPVIPHCTTCHDYRGLLDHCVGSVSQQGPVAPQTGPRCPRCGIRCLRQPVYRWGTKWELKANVSNDTSSVTCCRGLNRGKKGAGATGGTGGGNGGGKQRDAPLRPPLPHCGKQMLKTTRIPRQHKVGARSKRQQ